MTFDTFDSELYIRTLAGRARFDQMPPRAPSILARLTLAGALMATPVSARAAQDVDLYAAAMKNHETEVTWYQSHFRTEAAEKIIRAFADKYPGIGINSFNSTAAVAYQRVTQDLQAGASQADIFGTTDATQMSVLKAAGNLEKFVPENVSLMVPAVKALNDPDGFYTVTYGILVALTYNTDKVKPADVPTNWTDLADKKWQGQVTLGSPNYSGGMAGWTVAMQQLYGPDFVQKLADNKPLVGRSMDDTLIHLNSGESSIAAGDVASTSRSIVRGNPLGIAYPSDGALLLVGPTAILKTSKRPNASKLFVDFLLSPEAARVIVSQFEQGLIVDAPAPLSGKPLKDIKTISVPTDVILKTLPGIKERWKTLFGE
jgi:iron(III) transport system substrate-binding protein